MKEFGINLLWNEELTILKATNTAKSFTFHISPDGDNSAARSIRAKHKSYQKATRLGGPDTLNIWIVNSIVTDSVQKLNGVCIATWFP